MTKTPLLDFYVRLGEDNELFAEFERDPEAAYERAGFSADALATLLEGDLESVRVTIGDEIRTASRSEHTPGGEHHGDDDDQGEHHGDDDDQGEHHGDDGGGGEHHPDGEHH
jgi:hypothetical protein